VKVLILGGTGEAVALAERLSQRDAYDVTTSLAGRTSRPVKPAGGIRSGGFGGEQGLRCYLLNNHIDAVIDATHPFAAQISSHLTAALAGLDVACLRLIRPPWEPERGDTWIDVDNEQDAVRAIGNLGLAAEAVVFLAIGRQALGAFAGLTSVRLLARMIEVTSAKPTLAQFGNLKCIVARGPFFEADERALFAGESVRAVVTRNSGGQATYAKLLAARALRLPVVMICRPHPEPGPMVTTPEQAAAWLDALRASGHDGMTKARVSPL
jgi:precorrin-6A/cobalt-precorrin-6A reductase